MHPALRRSAALLLLTALPLGGCTTWRTRSTPAPASGDALPNPVRIRHADHYAVVLHDPRLEGDSLVGYTRGDWTGTRVAFALDDVERIEARRVDALRTGVLVAGVTVVALGAYVAYVLSTVEW